MDKREKFHIELRKVIRNYLDIDDKRLVADYFINNSHLSRRKANLELTNAFTDISAEFEEED